MECAGVVGSAETLTIHILSPAGPELLGGVSNGRD